MASALSLDSIRPAGALHMAGGETIVLVSSFAQARIVFDAALTSLELMGERDAYRVLDQQNMAVIQHRETKARLRVAGSDNRRVSNAKRYVPVEGEIARTYSLYHLVSVGRSDSIV